MAAHPPISELGLLEDGGAWASTAFGEPRFTNDVDILADFTLENVARFLADILLAKLHRFRLGGEVSEVQWRDIQSIVRNRDASLDRHYLALNAERLGVEALLKRALASQ